MDGSSGRLSKEHYKELSKWFERVAVLVLASLVVQKILLGGLGSPTIYLGAVASLILYFVAYQLLIRS